MVNGGKIIQSDGKIMKHHEHSWENYGNMVHKKGIDHDFIIFYPRKMMIWPCFAHRKPGAETTTGDHRMGMSSSNEKMVVKSMDHMMVWMAWSTT